jgi:nicotinamidase-related amidase
MENECKTLLQYVGVKSEPSTLKDAALVIIDMQNEYLSTGNVPLEGVENAIQQGKLLLERARKQGSPVVHVVHHGPKGSGFYDPEGVGGQINENVKPIEGEPVIEKNYVNAFVNTNMKEVLEKIGKKELIIIGFMTHMCLSTFVRSAVEQYGYKCTVVASCTASRTLPSRTGNKNLVKANDVHEGNLAALADYFACVVDSIQEIKDE